MEQYTDSQYDDDLTVGIDDAEDSFDAGFVDLFERSGNEESPIARLKTIVLSIDWEINDEVLTQFNEELLELKEVWAGEQVRLVYVQALEKISKYIYQYKSDSHPNAIKLLLNFYYNLEKVVLGTDLSDTQKKEILRDDVKKFEQLKQQIGKHGPGLSRRELSKTNVAEPTTITEQGEPHPTLFNLKACILGMDWEITERELTELGAEVKRLEEEFAGERAKMIFLQGIGALGGYIKLKKSDAHADAFKLLYSFYEGLEKIVVRDLSREDVKAILLDEVEKFEEFKSVIASTISPEALAGKPSDDDSGNFSGETDDTIAPAFADVPDEVHGFQAEKEAADLGGGGPSDVDSRLNNFFGEGEESEQDVAAAVEEILPKEALEKIDSFFGEEAAETTVAEVAATVSAEDALRGVDVETEADDDSDEEALPTEDDGKLAPALSDSGGEEHGFNLDMKTGGIGGESSSDIDDHLGGLFDQEESSEQVDRVAALQGVDVETEADDESGEAPLPVIDDEIAPALSMEDAPEEDGALLHETSELPTDLDERLDSFFDEPEDEETELIAALTEEDAADEVEGEVAALFDEPAKDDSEAPTLLDEEPAADEMEDEIASFFDEPEADAADAPVQLDEESAADEVEDEIASFFDEPAADAADAPVQLDEEPAVGEMEDEIASFFDEPAADAADDAPVELGEEPAADEVKDEIASFFDEPAADTADIPVELDEEPAVGEMEDEIASFFDEPATDAAEAPVELGEEPAAEEVAEDESVSLHETAEGNEIAAAPSFTIPREEHEEVVFEAVQGDDDTAEEEIPLALIDEESAAEDSASFEESASFGSDTDENEFFAAIDERVDEPGEFQMELLDEADEFEPGSVQFADQETETAISEDVLVGVQEDSADRIGEEDEDTDSLYIFTSDDDNLADLRAGIASIGVEINDSIIEAMLSEINSLRHRMMTRPIEKTLLQLLSTIVQHIGQYGYESSSEAHGLMLSVFDKLELTQNTNTTVEQAQEALLAETCKILLWQQKMLDRQAVRKGDQLTFSAPVRSDLSEESSDDYVQEDDTEEADIDQEFNAVFEIVEEEEGPAVEEPLEAITQKISETNIEPDSSSTDSLAVLLKNEIKMLRESLEQEIRELRDKIRDKE